MRSPAWGEKLQHWPMGETLLGQDQRDIRRVGELIAALREARYDPTTTPTSQDWVCSTELAQTEFYKERHQEATRVQQALYEQALQTEGVPTVPLFHEEHAAGGPLHWN